MNIQYQTFLLSACIFCFTGCGMEVFFSVPGENLQAQITSNTQSNLSPVQSKSKIYLRSELIQKNIAKTGEVQVTFKMVPPEAEVYYSTDIKIFDVKKFTKYEQPILLDETSTVKYYAKIGDDLENIQTETITIDAHVKKQKIDTTKNLGGVTRKQVTQFWNFMEVQPPKDNRTITEKAEEGFLGAASEFTKGLMGVKNADINTESVVTLNGKMGSIESKRNQTQTLLDEAGK